MGARESRDVDIVKSLLRNGASLDRHYTGVDPLSPNPEGPGRSAYKFSGKTFTGTVLEHVGRSSTGIPTFLSA